MNQRPTEPAAVPAIDASEARASKTLGSLDLAACLLLPVVLMIALTSGNLFTLYQVQTQDLLVLFALVPALLLLQRWSPSWRLIDLTARPWLLLAAGIAIVLLLAGGARAWLWDFPVSRDEHMVLFDMAVYQKWRLAAPLAPEWRSFAEALVPAFLLNPSNPSGVVSVYLPVNALMRLVIAQAADPVLLNPLLALAGGTALFDIARRIFPADPKAVAVSLVVYALSSQMVANAMTMYAMTGHMALNLIWLAAFLRGGRAGHSVAIAVGFLATGLHQFAFHPLFAAPFILWRLRQGAWKIALLYAAAYAVILGWWIAFPAIVSTQTGTPLAGQAENNSSFAAKVIPLLIKRDPLTLPLMMLNLVRFVAWQHLALLPLFFASAPAAWRSHGPAAPMIWGIALGTLFIGFVLPYQGHGWGYRYFHPYLGSFALLAGMGYQRLAASAPRRTEGMFMALSVLTLVGAMPVLLWHMREFTRPHVVLDRYIAAQKADFVLVDTDPVEHTIDGRWAINAIDEVRNEPDLTNRPLRFSSRVMDERLVAELCRRGTVSVVTWNDMHRIGFGLNAPGINRRMNSLEQILRHGGCLVDG